MARPPGFSSPISDGVRSRHPRRRFEAYPHITRVTTAIRHSGLHDRDTLGTLWAGGARPRRIALYQKSYGVDLFVQDQNVGHLFQGCTVDVDFADVRIKYACPRRAAECDEREPLGYSYTEPDEAWWYWGWHFDLDTGLPPEIRKLLIGRFDFYYARADPENKNFNVISIVNRTSPAEYRIQFGDEYGDDASVEVDGKIELNPNNIYRGSQIKIINRRDVNITRGSENGVHGTYEQI